MKNNFLTRGQLETTLSNRIQAFYHDRLGHQPSKVISQLFDHKLTIILEDSITNAELLLIKHGSKDLAQQVRHQLDNAIRPQLKELIEEVLKVSVTDLFSDATLKTGRTGIIAILSNPPAVCNPESTSELQAKESLNQKDATPSCSKLIL